MHVSNFFDLNLAASYSNQFVVYQSSEDRNLRYKSFIEDILLGLLRAGAILIPSFDFFRAHHNKLYFEILRSQAKITELNAICSKWFGTMEDLLESNYRSWEYPTVIKSAEGCKSKSVFLARDSRALVKYAKVISQSFEYTDAIRFKLKKILKDYYVPESLHRKKFIVQDFIGGLDKDYKILVYGNQYFVLERLVRKHDFRASGSGLFRFPETPPSAILDAAMRIYQYFNVPYISLDIVKKNDLVVAVDVQFIMFGTYTVERSQWHFQRVNGRWLKVEGEVDLETVFGESLFNYIEHNYCG